MERHSKHFKVLNKSVLPSNRPKIPSPADEKDKKSVTDWQTMGGREKGRLKIFEKFSLQPYVLVCLKYSGRRFMWTRKTEKLKNWKYETHKPSLPLWSYKQNDNISVITLSGFHCTVSISMFFFCFQQL